MNFVGLCNMSLVISMESKVNITIFGKGKDLFGM